MWLFSSAFYYKILLGDIMERTDIYTVIGKNIKKYRKIAGLSGEQLARKANLSYGFIKNLEAKNVRATISIETLQLIADCLDTNIINLLKED